MIGHLAVREDFRRSKPNKIRISAMLQREKAQTEDPVGAVQNTDEPESEDSLMRGNDEDGTHEDFF